MYIHAKTVHPDIEYGFCSDDELVTELRARLRVADQALTNDEWADMARDAVEWYQKLRNKRHD